MKVIISGASGLVGKALTRALRARGHTVQHLVRDAANRSSSANDGFIRWDPTSASVDVPALEAADAFVHLSGAGIADGRWTPRRKQVLRSSRLDTTRVLVDSLAALKQKPGVFLSASAIGYYGDRANEILTESSSSGTDFLALLARDWEAEASRAQSGAGIRTVMLRFGIVLSSEGGALGKMVAPFRFGVGGRLGSGQQWMSWIALEDVVGAILLALENEDIQGPVNVVSPNPVRNADFARTIGKTLHRPAIVPAPPFALKLALGEMADALLLSSQRVQPGQLLAANYDFASPDLAPTLQKILRR